MRWRGRLNINNATSYVQRSPPALITIRAGEFFMMVTHPWSIPQHVWKPLIFPIFE